MARALRNDINLLKKKLEGWKATLEKGDETSKKVAGEIGAMLYIWESDSSDGGLGFHVRSSY